MPKESYKHLLLFLLTILSTYLIGGFWYSFCIMTILSAHEGGHYVMSKKYNVPATLPYFIPFPFFPFGTLGAVISMRGQIINRKALFDIGATGPLMGFILSVISIFIGLKYSQIIEINKIGAQAISLGDSTLFKLIQWMVLGKIPKGYDVILHPVAYAGWVGLFVTALNLLPIGQLDGGHVIYALFGQNARIISRAAMGALALITLFINPGWFLLLILLFFFGLKHPALIDDFTPLDFKRRFLGILIIIIFALSFTPVPFPFYEN